MNISASVEGLNEEVLDQLVESVEPRSGMPLVLLTAPRAGYGKTHLLGRVVEVAGSEIIMLPLAFRTGDVLTLTTITRRGLEALDRAAGQKAGWTRLREICAGMVSHLLHGLIRDGQVPSANPDQALRVLSGPVAEVYDATGAAHMIGDWLRKHAAGLRPVMARRVAKQTPLNLEMAESWLEAMMSHALEGGAEGFAVMQELAGTDHETGTPSWLRLLSLWQPVVVLVDHLDGYYRNPDAGVTIASLLMDLVDAHGVHVLLSLNQDIWQATFGHHLPSALEDRLTASQVLLRGLREADASALLHLRLKQSRVAEKETSEFISFVDVKRYFLGRPIGSVSARVFLRHCARQWEVFQTSAILAASTLSDEDSGAPPSPKSADTADKLSVPLMNDAVSELPDIFDDDTSSEMRQMAETLAEPKPALPQNEPPPVAVQPPAPAAEPATISDRDHSPSDWRNTSTATAEVAALSTATAVAPSADAFVKLREMLHHLRQPEGKPGEETLSPAYTPDRQSAVTAAVTTSRTAAPAASPPPLPSSSRPGDVLLGRFEALRLQMTPEAETQPLDYAKLGELIRLAGRRFPLVRLSEHELPGVTGSQTMVWSLQGVELLFGLAPFTDHAYWRTLAGFAAGRLTDLAAEAERDECAPAKLKLVTFKSDREQTGWQSLESSQTIPVPLKPHLDPVHLDTQSVASLYAMQRIIKDAETGAVQAEPAQVMTVLARELDFFWKRITRI